MKFFNNKFVIFSTRNFLFTLKNSSGGQWEENHLYYCDPGVCPCHARESVGEDYLVSFSQDRKGNNSHIIVPLSKFTSILQELLKASQEKSF